MYFSWYPKVWKLPSTTSSNIISALKSVFARHGIPEVLRSNNGPQYVSREFKMFASLYNFQHLTSSPRFPQSNGQTERSVQTVKNLLKKADDPYMALLSYRATPLSWCDLSPAELSMGRRLRTSVLQANSMLIPQWSYLQKFRESEKQYKAKQKGTSITGTEQENYLRSLTIQTCGLPQNRSQYLVLLYHQQTDFDLT